MTADWGREGPPEGIRLQKVLAEAGVGSRRAVEDLIRAGRVQVNGTPSWLGQRVNPAADAVEVDGRRVVIDPSLHYLMLHKPAGVISTSSDPRGRRTVLDLVGTGERLFSVGRLDMATEGLLILTNDGGLAHRLMHPSFGVVKTYVAEVAGAMDRREIGRLAGEGISVGGRTVKPEAVRILAARGSRSVVEVSIHEGRKHVVRLMLAATGHPVKRLVRTGFGPLALGRLAPGSYRKLTMAEVSALYRAAGLDDRETGSGDESKGSKGGHNRLRGHG